MSIAHRNKRDGQSGATNWKAWLSESATAAAIGGHPETRFLPHTHSNPLILAHHQGCASDLFWRLSGTKAKFFWPVFRISLV